MEEIDALWYVISRHQKKNEMILSYVTWDVSPEIFSIGPFSLRWYGLFFAIGFLIGYYIVRQMFRAENEPEEWLEKIFMYMVLGTIVGARLGHVFFYDWGYYSQNLHEIPMVWKGGLASHGGALGVMLGLWIFSTRVSKRSILWILDRVVVPTAMVGCFIRLGNLMNSEIYGTPTDVSWAFLFVRNPEVRDIPVHPVQLYESLSYLASFILLMWVYWRTEAKKKQGYIFGLFFVLIWGARFVLEFFKGDQGGFAKTLGDYLSTGQWLSIPFFLIGIYFMARAKAPAPSRATAGTEKSVLRKKKE